MYTCVPNNFSSPQKFSSGFEYKIGGPIFICSFFFCLHRVASGSQHIYTFAPSDTRQKFSYKWVTLVGFAAFLWSLSIIHTNIYFLCPCFSNSPVCACTHTHTHTHTHTQRLYSAEGWSSMEGPQGQLWALKHPGEWSPGLYLDIGDKISKCHVCL